MSEEKKELVDKAVEAATKAGDAADKAKEVAAKAGDVADKAADAVGKTWPDVASDALEGLKAGLGDVAKVVSDISQELAQSAPHIWRGLVAYHRAMAIGELVVSFLWLVGGFVLFYYGKKNFSAGWAQGEVSEREKPDKEWPGIASFKTFAGVVMMVISALVAIVIIKDLPEELGDVFVPERRAAIEVITVIKGGGTIPQR